MDKIGKTCKLSKKMDKVDSKCKKSYKGDIG
jgi:hypothetical protein